MTTYIVIFGALIQLVGSIHYLRETIAGRTKPNRVTWFMWSLAPMIGTAAAVSDGVTLATLPVFMAGFGPFLVFVASFVNKKSYWKLESFDYWCGLFSLLALLLWYITKNPNIAIIFAILSDGAAAVPTLFKSWKHPETETASPYLATMLASATSFLVIKAWNFSEWAFPAYLLIICTVFVVFIVRGRFKKNVS